MKLTVISLILCFLLGCSSTSERTIIKSSRIDLPDPPKPVGIKGSEGVTPNDYEVVDPPFVAESYQYFRAYKDGAIIWKPRDWRTINHYMKSSENWINMVKKQVESHNRIFESSETKKSTTNSRKWYQFW